MPDCRQLNLAKKTPSSQFHSTHFYTKLNLGFLYIVLEQNQLNHCYFPAGFI